MKKCSVFMGVLSRRLDYLAGSFIVGVMVLVVVNILLRTIFKISILGTYELVGFLTAAGVSLALAQCAFQNGHIAVDFLVKRFSLKVQFTIDNLTNILALVFWSLSFWHLIKYAHAMAASGVVSATARIPVYPVIYLVALGLFGLCLVILSRSVDSFAQVLAKYSPAKVYWQAELNNSPRKEIR